jgi:hypothetical protein
MKAHQTLAISSIAASLITLAASPALAVTPLEKVVDLVDFIQPSDNAWGTCNIVWAAYTATSNGACLFTRALADANGYTNATIKLWWGSTSPSSAIYYQKIVDEVHFENITDIEDILPGDLISISYTDNGGGASMIVEDLPVPVTATAPIITGTTQWVVGVIDSTQDPHWNTDSRWLADGGVHDKGVGRGQMRIYVNDTTGLYDGHAWSMDNGPYKTQLIRPLAVGHFVP